MYFRRKCLWRLARLQEIFQSNKLMFQLSQCKLNRFQCSFSLLLEYRIRNVRSILATVSASMTLSEPEPE